MSTYEKACADAYKSKLPYPERPTRPPILARTVSTLSADEVPLVAAALKAHGDAMQKYAEDKRAYAADEARLHDLFREDLEREFKTAGHAKADKLFDMAWREGHASGFAEVAGHYADFVDLVL